VLCGLLDRIRPRLEAGRRTGRLRILDFACGYGLNAALLLHRVSLPEIYAHYGGLEWSPAAGKTNWARDREFFAARRRALVPYDFAGLDVADRALDYARGIGVMAVGFNEDLTRAECSRLLARFLSRCDLVIECGAVGPLLERVFPRLVEGAAGNRPWFLYCPRPDVDWTGLACAWESLGYVAERCNRSPVRYRRPLGEYEQDDVRTRARAAGVPDGRVFAAGYIAVDIALARPAGAAAALPLASLVAGCDDLWE
jgi:SAM-dependent methyltransferase